MGYSSSPFQLAKNYMPTDAIIVGHDADVSHATTTWTLKKSIVLTGILNPKSLFRFKFDLRLTAGIGTAYGQIRRNGVIIGTEQSTGNTAFTTYTQDIVVTGWKRGDSIELWLKAATADSSTARNFRLCGLGSEFEHGV